MKKLLLITAGFYISQMLYAQTPVAYYPLNGNGNDASGNGFNGTIVGTITPTADRFGNPTGAMNFPGSGYIQIADNAFLRPGSFTLSAWVYLNNQNSLQTFVNKAIGTCINDSWHFGTEGGNFSTWVSNSFSCGDFVQLTSASTVGTWKHIAYTLDATADTRKLYVDGVLVASGTYTSSIPYDASPVLLGAAIESGSIGAFAMNGKLDAVKIYNTALTASDILDLYNNTEVCNGIDDDEDGLIDETCIPTVSITGKSVFEGNSDTTDVKLTVTLSNAYESTVTVKYKTANKTATAGSDYVAVNKTLKFNPGQTSKKITVQILGDVIAEPNEDLYVILSNPVNATLNAADTATVKIKNDDGAAAIIAATNESSAIGTVTIKLSPNPAKDLLNITGLSAAKGSIIITDLQGKTMIKQIITTSTATVNISRLATGMYMLSFLDGNTYKTIKFIKE